MDFFSQLHPKLVHFPIAFFFLYTLLECIYAATEKSFFSKSAQMLLILGMISSVAALLTGEQAASAATEILDSAKNAANPEIRALIDSHNSSATALVWFFTFLSVYRSWYFIQTVVKNKPPEKSKVIRISFVILALTGCYFLYMTHHEGGRLVYEHGVGSELFKQHLK